MKNFRFENREMVNRFILKINESAAIINDADTDDEVLNFKAHRTGPHISHHLTDQVVEELKRAEVVDTDEYDEESIAKHLVRVMISSAFCGMPYKLAEFEQKANELIGRYDAGDYSYSIEETNMNQESEKRRTRVGPPSDSGFLDDILDLLKGLIEKKGGEVEQIKFMDEDELIEHIRKRKEGEAE